MFIFHLLRGAVYTDIQHAACTMYAQGLKLHSAKVRKRPSNEVKLALYELSVR